MCIGITFKNITISTYFTFNEMTIRKNDEFILKMANAENTIFVKHKIFSWYASYPFSFHFFISRNTETGYVNVFFKYWQSKIMTNSTKNTQE